MIVPPFAGVTLVEFSDRIELLPTYWVREFIGLGRFKASEVGPQPGEPLHDFYHAAMGEDVWVIAVWKRYDDGREEAIRLEHLDSSATEADAWRAFERAERFQNMSKQELLELNSLFKASDEDIAYIEERFPGEQVGCPDNASLEERDLYQARLRVLAGMHPRTVELIRLADAEKNPERKKQIERETVQSFFAELAHVWTEDDVQEWQRSNPLGTEWIREFARVFEEPEREIDPVNHELALNWLRKRYNLLTAEELSDAILVRSGQRLMPGALKKRRERLGLTTKRPPGPRPNEEK